ncbi:hypothetical protein EMCRGX_G027542 [Ephydatia muelleri]
MAARRLLLVDNYKAHMTDESERIVNENCNAAVDGSENAKMFSHVPCVALEENSDEEPSYQEADNDESSAEDKGMVPGDDFEGLDSDVDPFDTDLTYS